MWPGRRKSPASDSGCARARGKGALLRRNSGRRAAQVVDGDGKGRAVSVRVVLDHRREFEPLCLLARQRHTDEPARFVYHIIYIFRPAVVRRHHEVSLVLTVLIVDDDHHLTRLNVGDRFFDRVEHLFPSIIGDNSVSSSHTQ